MKAAGILFRSPSGNALFLKRGPVAPDCPGCWDFPGGGQEGDETALDTAIREAGEETGVRVKPDGLIHLTRTKSNGGTEVPAVGRGAPAIASSPGVGAPLPDMPPGVDFTTFLAAAAQEFVPELDDEHVGYAWAPIDSPPQPLHPGCHVALARITMNELDVARAIADGRLTSPQRYENVWLFAIRLTGTGVAYRNTIDEFAYRNPDNYLNDEFLARCNGLPVIYRQRSGKDEGFHPAKAVLDSREFSERIVGSIFLPYIAGAEVWGIAKIFDDAAAADMEAKQLSTSPAVFFRDVGVNAKLTLEDGSTLLIEGNPSLLDHVAVCEQGVWDKGGDPTGVRSESRGDSAMDKTEADKAKKDAEDQAKKDAEEKARKDAEEAERKKADAASGDKLDKVLSHLDSVAAKMDDFGKRVDAMEEREKSRDDAARKDAAKKDDDDTDEDKKKEEAERAAADKAKKDAEEKEEAEKKKADSFDVRKRIDEVAAMIPKNIGDADYHSLLDAQSRADSVYMQFGQHAPRPLAGENVPLYERRVIKELKQHSPTWKDAEVGVAFADDASFKIVRDQVYREAEITARSPTTVGPGLLREVVDRRGGHEIHTFIGQPATWMNQFAGHVKLKGTGSFKHERLSA